MIGYFSEDELKKMGFAQIGKNVRISRTTTIYNCQNVSIGNNVRVDNFCTLAISGSAKLVIGSNVQISAYSFMNGMGNITLEDFVTLAPYVRLFSSSDDYSGTTLTGATIPAPFLGTHTAAVYLEKHTILGVGVSVMPGVHLAQGTAVAGHSFVAKNSDPFTIIGGVPAKFIKSRKTDLLQLEKKFLANE
jgi:acetyltransferase-like isoleucine patch superfamily enzyme